MTIASLQGMRDRTIVINGFSKSHAMTGWRLGYACGPRIIIEQMLKIHQFAIMCAPSTSQYAGVEALRNGDEDVAAMREEYNGDAAICCTGLKRWDCPVLSRLAHFTCSRASRSSE